VQFLVEGMYSSSASNTFRSLHNIAMALLVKMCSLRALISHYQGPQHPEPSSVYVDQRALRVDRVTLLERGAPHSVCLMECGKILPDVKVAIVHPDTRAPCAHTDLGEVRTQSIPFPNP